MEAQPRQLQQMTLSEILDGAFSVCRAHFGELVKTVAVVLVPAQLLGLIILLAAPDGTTDLLLGTSDPDDTVEVGSALAVFGFTLLSTFASLLATAAAYRFVSDAHLGFDTDWRESVSFGLKKLHSILWIILLVALGATVGFLLLIIPGIYILVAWVLAIPVLLSEDARGSKALGRSYRLVRGNWWKTFGTLLIAGIIVGLIQAALSAVVTLVVADSDAKAFEAILATLLYLVLYLISIPFTTAVLALIYFDLRVRKEGVDLAMAAEGIGGDGQRLAPPPPDDPPPPAAPVDFGGLRESDVAIVRQFLDRRVTLDPGARLALASQLAEKVEPLVAGVERGDDDERFLETVAASS